MTDLIERLRSGGEFCRERLGMSAAQIVTDEAADEIERLRVALEKVAACETEHSNATVKRMARIARAALCVMR